MLEKAPQLAPQTLLLHHERTFPGQEWYRRKRTLQRRVEQWRALHGPAPRPDVPAGTSGRGAGHLGFHAAQGRTDHSGRCGFGAPAVPVPPTLFGLVPYGGHSRRRKLCRPG